MKKKENTRVPVSPTARVPVSPTARVPVSPTTRGAGSASKGLDGNTTTKVGIGSDQFVERFTAFKNSETTWNAKGFKKKSTRREK